MKTLCRRRGCAFPTLSFLTSGLDLSGLRCTPLKYVDHLYLDSLLYSQSLVDRYKSVNPVNFRPAEDKTEPSNQPRGFYHLFLNLQCYFSKHQPSLTNPDLRFLLFLCGKICKPSLLFVALRFIYARTLKALLVCIVAELLPQFSRVFQAKITQQTSF